MSTLSLSRAEPEALRINGYFERLAGQPTDDGREAVRLHRQLQGQTLAGSKPDFDAALLGDLFARADSVATFDVGELGPPGPSRPMRLRQPWHHQLASLGSYAAGVFGLPMSQIPSQRHVCERLGVENTAPHTALGDCQALLECLYRLGAVPRPDEIGGAA